MLTSVRPSIFTSPVKVPPLMLMLSAREASSPPMLPPEIAIGVSSQLQFTEPATVPLSMLMPSQL